MNRPSISLCIIVKNEEHNLPNLLKSVEGCFDEICITDTGSTDNTVKVAESFGCKVSHFKWVYDFSSARNFNFSQAKSDYIMWMDGDDFLETKEQFILWRDTCLKLSDYYLARYDYTSDDKDKVMCSFFRERVIKNKMGMQWVYFVHEGIKPNSPYGPLKVEKVNTWSIRHRRTEADLAADKSRNLNMFEFNKHNIDSRMLYYWGKELHDMGKFFDACMKFQEAVSKPDLELHDRVLAMQYLGYCYLHLSQPEKCIDISLTGLHLSPHRAEFFCNIGDAYLKLNQYINAIPFFEAASKCQIQSNQGAGIAVFHTEACYTVYPRMQLARVWYHNGALDKAIEIIEESLKLYPNHKESQDLLTEFRKQKLALIAYKSAEPCDDIVITTGPVNAYTWDSEVAKTKNMGGSETAAIEMAEWLHKLSGRPVKVINMRDNVLTANGVEYLPTSKIHDYFGKHKPWLHIAWRHNFKLTDAPTFLWCHDLFTPGAENTAQYLKLLCLTPFHKNYSMATQGIPEDKIYLTRNGIKPERFSDGPWEKDPFKFIFSSSPDRGLDRAMKVLDRVREKYPQITLHIHYGVEHLDKYGLKSLREKLQFMMNERKDWIVYHGATQQDKLMKNFKSAAYNIQPSDWVETSCLTALELACCGVYPIFRKVGGVVDTLAEIEKAGMATLVDSDCITEAQHDLYAQEVIKAIEEERYKRVKVDAEQFNWKYVAEQWLKDLPEIAYGNKI